MLNIEEIVKATNAELLVGTDENKDITCFSTDTRTIKQDDFYLPLKGESFNGEDFIEKALDNGAVGYFTTSDKIFGKAKYVLKVEDTKVAYLQLANLYRNKLNPKTIMITGSSGKTTTKELVSSVCSQKYNTVRTVLNHNNEIGFCQTVFSMNKKTEVLIIEAGMRGLGEIELISKYCEPDISIISNVGTAHIGRLGSRENIAKAKCEIVKYQKPDGILIAHNNQLIKDTVEFSGRKKYYLIDDVEIIDRKIGSSKFKYENEEYELLIEGDYNIENSLSAINVGKELNIEYDLIKKGLKEYKPIEKRWEIEEVGGYKIINDSYNANPESMKATLNTILDLYSDIIVILGNMGELGENEKVYHKEVGTFINTKNKTTPIILTVGDLANEITNEITVCKSINFKDNTEVSDYIKSNFEQGKTIFLKASRSMKFEEIIKNLKGEN